MGTSPLMFALIAAAGLGDTIAKDEVEKQETVFAELWNDDFVWKFADLPSQGGVPKDRIPYSGFIYLDKQGGTAGVLRKYDVAINNDHSLPATGWEYSDTAAAYERTRVIRTGGLFRGGSRVVRVGGVNHWYGHCNGWSAAAIRHAEPQNSVTVGGVEFTPADIKGLLAEAYMYNEHELLAGFESFLNPGTLHAILANWLGRGSHAIVMDADPGKEKWNYPIYGFASSHVQRSPRTIEVRTNIRYAKDTDDREHNRSPRLHKQKSFHYMLELNGEGEIVGGYYYNDSERIDFVWVPLDPKQSGEEGNERGNPHIDVAQVMEIWRQSVPREVRRRWLTVDPFARDRTVEVSDPTKLLPRGIRIVPGTASMFTMIEAPTGDEDASDGSTETPAENPAG